jgi:RimJ/RimL family protein N-acetyltransferase
MSGRLAFLTTPRLIACWWTRADEPLAHLLWGDPAVMRYMGGPHRPELVLRRFERQFETAASHGVQYWLFMLRSGTAGPAVPTGDHRPGEPAGFVGCCGLKPPPERYGPDVLETGFHLRPAFWGQGYASEMARAVITYAFTQAGAAALFAGHHPENHASGRVLAKLGFQPDGAEFYEPTGLWHPAYLLRAADWR